MNKYILGILLFWTIEILILLMGTRANASMENEPIQAETTEIDIVQQCGTRLLGLSGKEGTAADKLTPLYSRASVSKDIEFMTYLLAVIFVESRFNKQALSPAAARGLMQMTAIATMSASHHCNLKQLDSEHLFDSYTNVKYGSCYLKKMLDESDGDWTKTLILYNGGYKQAMKYERGESIVTETANYVLLVKRAREICLAK